MLATIIITYNPDIGKVNSLIQSIVLNKDSCVIVVDNKSLNIKDFSNLFTIDNVVHTVFRR